MEQTELLGCKAGVLEVGTEFSHDEGTSWCVVKKIGYVSEESTVLDVWVQPSDDVRLSASYHVYLEETEHVLLQRNWKA